MRSVGILKDSRNGVNSVPTPLDLRGFNNEITFYIEQDAGKEMGFGDAAYEQEGCIVVDHRENLINWSDIIIIHDEIRETLELNSPKIMLTDVDVKKDFAFIIPFVKEPVDLFSFHANLSNRPVINHYSMKELYKSFIKFFLGEPISSEMITLIANAKVLNKGKVTHPKLVELIDNY